MHNHITPRTHQELPPVVDPFSAMVEGTIRDNGKLLQICPFTTDDIYFIFFRKSCSRVKEIPDLFQTINECMEKIGYQAFPEDVVDQTWHWLGGQEQTSQNHRHQVGAAGVVA